MSKNPQPLKPARLRWIDENTLINEEFSDIYFSRHGWMEESEYVFIKGNHLPERWNELKSGDTFRVGELGFGLGLNFLTTLTFWKNSQAFQNGARLEFWSCEKFPVARDDLIQVYNRFPEHREVTQKILDQYPKQFETGLSRMVFDEWGVTLNLVWGEALESVPHYTSIDAWFFDGFAPGKNPDMWVPALFQKVVERSNSHATLSTYSVANLVFERLSDVGFILRKIKGFAKKRQMIIGGLSAEWNPVARRIPKLEKTENSKIAIIGGGYAGCFLARELADRGWTVTLVERAPRLASEASGNLAAIVLPRFYKFKTALGDFALKAYYGTLAYLDQLKNLDPHFPWYKSGAFVVEGESAGDFLAEVPGVRRVSQDESLELTGVPLKKPGYWIESAGYVESEELCRSLIQGASRPIEVIFESEVQRISHNGTRWELTDLRGNRILEADGVVLANALDALRFQQTEWMPLKQIRGQLLYCPEIYESSSLKAVLSNQGYVIPSVRGMHVVGATYDPIALENGVRLNESQELLVRFFEAIGRVEDEPVFPAVQDCVPRVAFRTSTTDKIPVVGAVPIPQLYRQNQKLLEDVEPFLKGLYVSLAFGAKGLTYCRFCSVLLADLIEGKTKSENLAMYGLISPERFLE